MRPHTGPKETKSAINNKQRQKPRCGLCLNHKIENEVINHSCEYKDCTCLLCSFTSKKRLVMRHQQRYWRFKKSSVSHKKGEQETDTDGDSQDDKKLDAMNSNTLTLKRQVREQLCDKCRNHNKLIKKRGHKDCPYKQCMCDACAFTTRRQVLLKVHQRVSRRQITGPLQISKKPSTDAQSSNSPLTPLEEVGTHNLSRVNERDESNEEQRQTAIPASKSAMLDRCRAEGEGPKDEASLQKTNQLATVANCLSPPSDTLPKYGAISDTYSSLMFNKNEYNHNSSTIMEYPEYTRKIERNYYDGQFPQIPTTSTTLPSFITHELDVGYHRFVPETNATRMLEFNNNHRHPVRPQPIPAVSLAYPSNSMLQSFPQPWQETRTECNRIQSSYSTGHPSLPSTFLQPSSKSGSFIPTTRIRSDYPSQLPGYK